MTDHNKGRIAARLGGLSTGLKMLLILAAGLLPLGIVAVLASVYSARDNWSRDEVEMRAVLNATAQRLDVAVVRSAVVIRAASPALAHAPAGSDLCARTIERVEPLQVAPVRYAIYGRDGRPLCSSPGYAPPAGSPARPGSHLEIDPAGRLLRFVVTDEEGRVEGRGEYGREALAQLVQSEGSPIPFDIDLAQGDRVMPLRQGSAAGHFQREVTLTRRVAGGLELRLRAAVTPITAAELLMVLLPILMLLAAALIGWWILDRLLLRPLGRMQRAVAAYRPGDRGFDLPSLRSPAREIAELGQSFDGVTRTVARHEAELEAAVDRQTRLVREVHHRVKNNLQVVASLLNLHARGATSDDVAAAYASIQRRVDALAVVHRNHYAELEENRGVALRSLIAELAANLRATAPASASQMQIRLDIEPFYGTQDVAVSIAILVTEIAELGMLCGASWVAITLEGDGAGFASLAIETDALAGEIACDEKLFERFDRIVTGLSRQLRSTLDRDSERGRYSVRIAVAERAER
ncbi:MAG: two-component system, sensor histidine kinase PdtaS [Sphingomonadales bacterium]|nr:two-component system, sensor histidine kinase PdtaS [Sphingomonadales bacterium]